LLSILGLAITGTSFIGVFNVSQCPLTELLHLSRFLCIVEAQYYIVRSHASGFISRPMQVVDDSSLICITLDIRGSDILSAYPLKGFVVGGQGKDNTTWIANLGLLGKMTGAAAIVKNDLSMRENGTIVIDTSLKALGVLGKSLNALLGTNTSSKPELCSSDSPLTGTTQ
jgi:hypothetical protein